MQNDVYMILLPPEVELWAETHYSLYRRPLLIQQDCPYNYQNVVFEEKLN